MKRMILYFVFALTLTSSALAQDYHINITERWWNNNPDRILENERLRNAIDTFFRYKNTDTLYQFCTPSDQNLWGLYPFQDVRYMEGLFGTKYPLRPTLLGAIETEATPQLRKYLVKIAYTANDDSMHNSVGCVYNLIVNLFQDSPGFSFERYTNELLQQRYHKKKVGNVLYYKAHTAAFSMDEAGRMNTFNDSLAQLFGVEPVKFVYFSCKNPIELFQLKGFDYVPNMFLAKTGGLSGSGGKGSEFEHIIYSANNKEYYPHEVCHFYINMLSVPASSNFAIEGIATFLGGSSERPYTHHARALKAYLDQNTDKSMSELFATYSKIDEFTSVAYAAGAVMADMIYEKKGIAGFKSFLAIPQNELKEALPKLLGVSSEKELKEKAYRKLSQYQ